MREEAAAPNPWVSGVMATKDGCNLAAEMAGPTSREQEGNIGGGGDWNLGVAEKAFSAAGAAFLSAIIVNPLDVAKTRLQAQAAGAPYSHPLSNIVSRMSYFGPSMMFADLRCSPSCAHAGVHGTVSICPPDCFQYKGTLDVLNKIIRQLEICWSLLLLWHCGRNWEAMESWLEDLTSQNVSGAAPYVPLVAGSLARSFACATCYPIELARTRMQAFKASQVDKKLPGVAKTLLDVLSHVRSSSDVRNNTTVRGYRVLWTGMGAQLARDVPFSAICWPTLEPIRRRLLHVVGEESNVATILGANFFAGFVAGSLAAGATCPLDVAKTRRQIEKDPVRALRMTTWKTLVEVWRDGGVKTLFTGAGPRVGRAGPSVGIVVSFYEVVKHVLHQRRAIS